MKKYTVIMVVALILGFLVGVYLYKINYKKNNNEEMKIAQKVEDECTDFAELEANGALTTIVTNGQEEKISPNCLLTLKIYYNAIQTNVALLPNVYILQLSSPSNTVY